MSQSTANQTCLVKDEAKPIRVLVFAAERFGLSVPNATIRTKLVEIVFADYESPKRFDDFDGVIVFQNTFETISKHRAVFGGETHIQIHCDQTRLETREKDLARLLGNNGFVVFLLHDSFRWGDCHEYKGTDLVKRSIDRVSFSPRTIQREATGFSVKRSELLQFCDEYIVAETSFCFAPGIRQKIAPLIEDDHQRIVGFSVDATTYYIPCKLPDKDETERFFKMLIEAVVSINKKDRLTLPPWVEAFIISGESQCRQRITELNDQIRLLSEKKETFNTFKHVLCSSGEQLVKDVANLLKHGLGLPLNETDKHHEDLKILDNTGKPLAFIEVKGVNGNVTRDQIDQTASHREKADLPDSFPSILIINTYNRSARAMKEKDSPPPTEQIAHANKVGVLVLRTIDLLYILNHYLNGTITQAKILENFSTLKGWWHSSPDQVLFTDPQSPRTEEQS